MYTRTSVYVAVQPAMRSCLSSCVVVALAASTCAAAPPKVHKDAAFEVKEQYALARLAAQSAHGLCYAPCLN